MLESLSEIPCPNCDRTEELFLYDKTWVKCQACKKEWLTVHKFMAAQWMAGLRRKKTSPEPAKKKVARGKVVEAKANQSGHVVKYKENEE